MKGIIVAFGIMDIVMLLLTAYIPGFVVFPLALVILCTFSRLIEGAKNESARS